MFSIIRNHTLRRTCWTKTFLFVFFFFVTALHAQIHAHAQAQKQGQAQKQAQQENLPKPPLEKLTIAGRSVDYFKAREFFNAPLPLIIILHGDFANNQLMRQFMPLYELSMTRGFNVAYIQGTKLPFLKNNRVWNAGKCCGIAVKNNINDVGYINQVISYFMAQPNIDPSNIFLVGFSNGAMMAYRYACENPGKLKGVIAISGIFAIDECLNLNGLNVFHLHGSADKVIPITGGGKGYALMKQDFPSLSQTEDMLKNTHARYIIDVVQGAGHGVQNLNNALQKKRNITLPELIANVIDGMKTPVESLQ